MLLEEIHIAYKLHFTRECKQRLSHLAPPIQLNRKYNRQPAFHSTMLIGISCANITVWLPPISVSIIWSSGGVQATSPVTEVILSILFKCWWDLPISWKFSRLVRLLYKRKSQPILIFAAVLSKISLWTFRKVLIIVNEKFSQPLWISQFDIH